MLQKHLAALSNNPYSSIQAGTSLKTVPIHGILGIVVGDLMEKAADKLLSIEAFRQRAECSR